MADKAAIDAEAIARMTRVRARLITEHPFFGDLALRLRFKEDRSCRDMWTDGRTMGYNPVYASAIPEDRLMGAQAHEVLHIVFGHHLRRKDREKTLWNRACDLAVNGILLNAGFNLPDGFLYNERYTGKTADEIYDILVAAISKDESKGQERRGENRPSPHGTTQSEGMNGQNSPRLGVSAPNDGHGAASEGEDKERSKQEGRGVKPVAGKKGGGKKQDGPAPRFDGEVRDIPEVEDGQGNDDGHAAAEREAEVTLTQAVSRAKRMGFMPAGLERHVEHVVPGSVDWREVLQRFLADNAENDYTWTTPNRRYIFQDIYMPSRREQRLSCVVVAVDASGSVDAPMLAMFLSELYRVLEFFDTTLTVLFHDTEVQKIQTVTRFDDPGDLVPRGGGGTDYRPIPKVLEKEGISPACMLWFTDLECTRFPEDPGCPVLWIVPKHTDDKPPFGEVVCLRAERF